MSSAGSKMRRSSAAGLERMRRKGFSGSKKTCRRRESVRPRMQPRRSDRSRFSLSGVGSGSHRSRPSSGFVTSSKEKSVAFRLGSSRTTGILASQP